MQRTIITLALIAGLTGPVCAQVGRADLLTLDDEALVSAYLAAVFRDAGDDEALARKPSSPARCAPRSAPGSSTAKISCRARLNAKGRGRAC